MIQRVTQFYLQLQDSLNRNLHSFVEDTVKGTLTRAYNLMLSPIYAGKTEGVAEDLKQYDRWLKKTSKELYSHCGRQRKHGIAYTPSPSTTPTAT